jgi:WS/DGAT/MGAT family acyltransferase
MADNIRVGIPLNNVDTAWLHMEDPTNLMMITGMYIFRQPLDFERVRDTIKYRMVGAFPRFKHKISRQGLRAYWVSDPKFDLDAHLHRVALPPPGDQIALQDMVSDIMSTPLDFSKPLWHLHLIDNVGTGCAVILRIHHCVGDGTALMYVLMSLTDTEIDAPWPSAQDVLQALPKRRGSAGFLGGLLRLSSNVLSTTRHITGTVVHEGLESIFNPSHAVDLAADAFSAGGALSKILLLSPDPKTVFKGPLGVRKRAAWSQKIPLADIKLIGKAMGGTVNDVLLSAVTGALRKYMEQRGESTDEINIRAMVPVDLRPPEDARKLGNKFGLIYLALPIYIQDPIERLEEVKRRMDDIKSTPEAYVAYQILNALGMTPQQISDRFVDMFGAKSSAVMTNVRGPAQAIYFSGIEIDTLMFWVPQSGRMGMGVSIFSYDNAVVLGIATDATLVPDPELINECFEQEFREMLEWVRLQALAKKPAMASLPAPSMPTEAPAKPRKQPPEPTSPSAEAAPPTARPKRAKRATEMPVASPVVVGDAAEAPVAVAPSSNGTQYCQAITKAGTPCKNKALPGDHLCRVHQASA